MTKRRFASYADVRAAVGQEVAVTDWITISQAQINQFADATGDPNGFLWTLSAPATGRLARRWPMVI